MYPDSPDIRRRVVAEAETWLRTPFHTNRSMIKGVGVACGPMLIAVYGALGIPVPSLDEIGHFSLDWHEHASEERYLNILLNYTKQVETPGLGDVALFKIGKVHGHSVIVTGWPNIIHVLWKSTVQHASAEQAPLQKRHRIFLSPFE